MKQNRIFKGTTARVPDFEFDEKVAKVLDNTFIRNVPFYREQQHMIVEIGKKFWIPGTNVYDLGCAAGGRSQPNLGEKDPCLVLLSSVIT